MFHPTALFPKLRAAYQRYNTSPPLSRRYAGALPQVVGVPASPDLRLRLRVRSARRRDRPNGGRV